MYGAYVYVTCNVICHIRERHLGTGRAGREIAEFLSKNPTFIRRACLVDCSRKEASRSRVIAKGLMTWIEWMDVMDAFCWVDGFF